MVNTQAAVACFNAQLCLNRASSRALMRLRCLHLRIASSQRAYKIAVRELRNDKTFAIEHGRYQLKIAIEILADNVTICSTNDNCNAVKLIGLSM